MRYSDLEKAYNNQEYDKLDSKTGKRYRKIGNMIDYEPTVFVAGIEVPISEADRVRKSLEESRRRKEAEEKAKRERESRLGVCPFVQGNNRSSCKTNCALFTGEGCKLKELANDTKTAETNGKKCPFSAYMCTSECELNKDNKGCSIARIK